MGIYTPVEIELCKKCSSHPVVRLTVGSKIICFAKSTFLRKDFKQFAFNKLGHFSTRLTVDSFSFLHTAIQDRAVSVELHHPEMIVGTHRTDGRNQWVSKVGTAISSNHLIGLRTSIHASIYNLGIPVLRGETVNRAVDRTSVIVVIASAEAYTHNFITLIHHAFIEVAAEPAMKEAIATVEFAFVDNRIVWKCGVLIVDWSIEIST